MDNQVPDNYPSCRAQYLKGGEEQEWGREWGYRFRPRLVRVKKDLSDVVEETVSMLKSFGAEILNVKYSIRRNVIGKYLFSGLYVVKIRKPVGH